MKKTQKLFILLLACLSLFLIGCAQKEECDFCGEMGVFEERSLWGEKVLVCEDCLDEFKGESRTSINDLFDINEKDEEDETEPISEKPRKIDIFRDIEISFYGISPKAKANININPNSEDLEILQSCYYNLDIQPSSNLKNGDKVVVTIEKPERLLDSFNVVPIELSKEYIVDGLDSYVDSADQIPKEIIQEFAKQYIEDTQSGLKDEDMWSYSEAKYYGSYLLWVKDRWIKHTNELQIFVCYDRYVHNEFHSTVYEPLRFYDVVIKDDGHVELSYENGETSIFMTDMSSYDENKDEKYEIMKID